MVLTFAWHVDADADVERALLHDKGEQAARISQGIEAGQRILESWVLRSHGRMLAEDGTKGSAQLDAEYLEELTDIVEQVEHATEARMQVGVGASTGEAVMALKVAEKRGGVPAIVLYTPDLSEEAREYDEVSDDEAEALETEDDGIAGGHDAPSNDGGGQTGFASGTSGLNKADNQREGGEATQIQQGQMSPTAAQPSSPSQPSASAFQPSPAQGADPGGQQPPQGGGDEEQVLQAVGQVLTQFKAQLPFFEQQVKQANPQAYQAVMGMVQGMIAMAKQLAGGDAEGTPPDGAKAEPGMQKSEKSEYDPASDLPPMETLRKLYDTVGGDSMMMGEASPTGHHFTEFTRGFAHERREHPHLNDHQAALTAKQHLAEDPQYYSKLGALEESGALGKDEPAAHHNVVLPVGSVGVGSRGRSVKVLEPTTGKTTWHQVSMGQKKSGDGHSLSPRVAECPSADSPEKRAADAGLVGAPTTFQPGQTAKPGKPAL